MSEKRVEQPEGRRHDDHALRQTVREVMAERSWQRSLVLGCTALCFMFMLVALAVSFFTLHNRRDIVHPQDLVAQIQRERARFVLDACVDQNAKHRATVRQLKVLTVQRLTGHKPPRGASESAIDGALAQALASANPLARKQATSSVATTILLIDTLVPEADCQDRVRRAVRAGTPTPR